MYDAVTKKTEYVKGLKGIDIIAVQSNRKPEDVALDIVKENIPLINKYVIEHGETPEKNPISLAAQAALIHESKIWDKIENEGIPDYDAAEGQVFAEEHQMELNGEVSNFGGNLLASIFKAGNKALDKINAKRVSKGKKPILAGEKGLALRNKILAHVEIEPVIEQAAAKKAATGVKEKSDVAIILDEVTGQIEKDKTNAAIKQYLPYAIVILIVVFFAGKKLG